jgi:hypothetical protein
MGDKEKEEVSLGGLKESEHYDKLQESQRFN